jgi:hypothetical protein
MNTNREEKGFILWIVLFFVALALLTYTEQGREIYSEIVTPVVDFVWNVIQKIRARF